MLIVPFLLYEIVHAWALSPTSWRAWQETTPHLLGAVLFLIAGRSDGRGRQLLAASLFLAAVGSAGLAFYQTALDPEWLPMGRRQFSQYAGRASGAFGSPNSQAGLLELVLPAAVALTLRSRAGRWERAGFAVLALTLAAGVVLSGSRGAWLALALVGTAAWIRFAVDGGGRKRLGWATAAIVVATLAFLALPRVQERLAALVRDRGETTRPVMWRAAWEIARDHPVWGGGLGSYGLRFGEHRPAAFQHEPVFAHNDYLNTLADGGAVGLGLLLLLGAGVFGWGANRAGVTKRLPGAPSVDSPETAGRGSDPVSAPGGGRFAVLTTGLGFGLAAFALHLAVEFHLKIPALVLAASVAAGLFLRNSRAVSVRLSRGGFGLFALAAAGVLLAGGWSAARASQAEAARAAAREILDTAALGLCDPRSGSERALERLRFAVQRDPGNAQAWADLASALHLRARETQAAGETLVALGRESERAAARALEESALSWEFWARLGVSLDMQGRASEARLAFQRALERDPQGASPWFYYADHLAADPLERERAIGAVRTCLSLDPTHGPGLSLAARLATAPPRDSSP